MDSILQVQEKIGKAICVFLFDVFNGFSTSIKEINNGCSISIKEVNSLIWNVKYLLLRKTDVLKTSIFSKRKFEKIH